jgi:predicted aspartyl protease
MPILPDTHLVVAAKLNQNEARFVLDTGAERSQVTPEAAHGHTLAHARGEARVTGVGGTITVPIVFANIELGGLEVRRPVPEAPIPVRRGAKPDDGIIGADLLSDYDMEVSIPERQVRLWRTHNCGGDYVPWPGRHASIPLRRTIGQRLFVPLAIDSVPLTAILDTGANATTLALGAAQEHRLDVAGLEADPKSTSRGVDGQALETYRHRFTTLTIGQEVFRNPTILVSRLHLTQGEMLLGLDWLRQRRIWISWDSRQLFVQDRRDMAPR